MEHPDVIQLENRLNRVWSDRDNQTARDQVKSEHDVNESTPPQVFLCSTCGKDYFPFKVVKVEVKDWNNNGVFRFWRSKHCRTWNVRLITDKVKDKFWIKSPSVVKDRRINKEALIQPQETGFEMLYGKHV